MRKRLLLIVTDTFAHMNTPIGPTLELSPRLIGVAEGDQLPDEWWPGYPRIRGSHPERVELRRPDGEVEIVACRLVIMHINYIDRRSNQPPGFKPPWTLACHLPNAHPEQAPPGTEVWYEDSVTPPLLTGEGVGG